MITKNPFLISSLAFAALLMPLTSNADSRYRDAHYVSHHAVPLIKARVIDVKPVFEPGRSYQEPVRTCYSERSGYDAGSRRKNAVIGGVVGGVIGYQLGDKQRQKNIGAVAGALLGAAVAKKASQPSNLYCETHYETRYDDRRRLIGYDVVYKYRGHHYTTFTDYRPGRWVEVQRPR